MLVRSSRSSPRLRSAGVPHACGGSVSLPRLKGCLNHLTLVSSCFRAALGWPLFSAAGLPDGFLKWIDSQRRFSKTTVASLSRCPVFIARDLSGFAFSSLLSFSLRVSGRRRCGSVEIRRFWVWPDFQARWKEGESPPFDFSTLSTARHFHSVARAVFSRPPATRPPPCTVRPREDRRRWSPAHPGARRWSPGKPPASLATVSARSATPDSLAERCCPWPPPARSAPRRFGPSPSLARGQTHGPSPPPLRRTCG